MKNFLALALAAACAFSLNSVYSQSAEDEDVFELSPFSVSRGGGYRSTSTLAGNRVDTSVEETIAFNDMGGTIAGMTGTSLAQFGEARSVTIDFAIGFYDDSEKTRRLTLNRHLDRVRQAVAEHDGLHFEPGALRIAQGDRKRLKGQRRSTLTSYAHFSVSFALEPGRSPFQRVKAARDLIANLELESDVTKLFFGDASVDSESPFHGLAPRSGAQVFRGGVSTTSDLGATLSFLTDRMHRAVPTSEPQAPVTLIKPIDAISLSFAIDYQADLESERRQALLGYLEAIKAAAEAAPGIEFEPGSLLLRHGDRSGELALAPGSFVAQAQFRLIVDLAEGSKPLENALRARRLAGELEIDPRKATLHYGPAHPIFDQPERFRSALLAAIFDNLAEIKTHLGDRYELEPRIANDRISVKQRSATEVELWMPYNYQVVSVADRDRKEAELARAHELALAQSKICCCANCANNE